MMFSISSDICRLGPLPEQIFLCNFRGKITEFVKFNSQRRFNLELNNNFKDFRFNVVNSTFRWYFSSKHLSLSGSTFIHTNWIDKLQIAKEPLNSQKFNSDWGLNVELDQDRDWGQFISQSVVWPVVARGGTISASANVSTCPPSTRQYLFSPPSPAPGPGFIVNIKKLACDDHPARGRLAN